jgi:hypothetical protein
MNNNKKCVVSFFSKGRENYYEGCLRMLESLNNTNYDGDALIFSPDFKEENVAELHYFKEGGKIQGIVGMPTTEKYGICPPHSTHPYAFKVYCIQAARERKYQEVIWLDCSVVALKNISLFTDLAWEIGLVVFDNQGCEEKTWTSDDCLEQLGVKAEEANYFQIDAAIQFWNFNRKKAVSIFEEYMKFCNDGISLIGKSGSNRPEFNAHRHDQSIISAIIRKYLVFPLNYGAWCTSEDALFNKEYDPTVAKIGIANTLKQIYLTIGKNKG